MSTHSNILKDLKNKTYKPIYLLSGEEALFIDEITSYIEENVLQESEKDFNQTIVYGRDSNVDEIIALAKQFPMMSDHAVVIVKEAQDLKGIDKLESYLQQPQNSTLLVLAHKHKKIRGNSKLAKIASKQGVFFQSEKIKDYKLPDWISSTVKSFGYTIKPQSCQLLAEHLGNDLSKIYKELEKLNLILPKGEEIDKKVIEENIGISKEYNVFELQKAISAKDLSKTNIIVAHFAKNEKKYPFPMVIGTLYSYFSKLVLFHYVKKLPDPQIASELRVAPFLVNEYRSAGMKYNAKRTVNIISILREYDLKSKGFGNTSATWGELLQEMTAKIILG